MPPEPIDAEVVDKPTQALALRPAPAAGAVGVLRPADTLDAIAEAFKQYQAVCERILTADDYQEYEGKPRKKKSAWRKLATAFNVSTAVVEKEIQRDAANNVISAFFTVRASVGNRETNGSGYCEVTERCCATRQGQKCHKATWKGHYCCPNGCDGRKHWSHCNHDVIATAETRAKNRAIADLIGCGEVSAEELTDDAPQRKAPAQPAPPSQVPAHAPKPSPQPATAQPEPIRTPTAAFRTAMIHKLKAEPGGPNRQTVEEYFRKLVDPTPLMPGEPLEQLRLCFVPGSEQQMKDLANQIDLFSAGHPAKHAYPPNYSAEEPQAPVKTPAQVAPKVLAETAVKAQDPEWWRDVIVPIPPKGMKRDAYLKNPQTIGQLFDARHGQDDESQAMRQRLWGFVNHFEPKGWEKRSGEKMPPSETDIKFREALDAFAEWFEKHHPDEKL